MWYVCVFAQIRVRVSTCLCCIRFFFQFFFWRFCCGFSTVARSCLGIYGMGVFARTSESESSRGCLLRFTLKHILSFFFAAASCCSSAAAACLDCSSWCSAQQQLVRKELCASVRASVRASERASEMKAHCSPPAAGAQGAQKRCAAGAALLAAVSCVLRFSSCEL